MSTESLANSALSHRIRGLLDVAGNQVRRLRPPPDRMRRVVLEVLAALSLLVWAYLALGHGAFWRPPRLPAPPATAPCPWPSVVAVVPARDEESVLPETLPTLLGQEYP